VNDAGCFTDEVGEQLAGKDVLGEGNKAVISLLRESGHLISEMNYKHK
jgi:isoleucyl-tRNA synthetase